VDEPDPERGRRVEALAGHEVPSRRAGPDPRDRERRDRRRDDPELDLGEGELRVLGGDHDVGARDEAAPAAEHVAMDPRDDGRRALVDRLEHLPEPPRVLHVLLVRELGRRAHPLDVCAGAEALALAREHDDARVAHVRERILELGDQRGVERVATVGPREDDAEDGPFPFDAECRHGSEA
jgi:hypothetical protein